MPVRMVQISFLLDENIDRRVAIALRTAGADVLTANDAGTLGYTDLEQLKLAASLGRVFVTHDKDLLDTVLRVRGHSGLIYLYRAHHTAQSTADALIVAYRTQVAEQYVGVTLMIF